MEYFSHLITSMSKPHLFKQRTPLFLLSHMRANTSLLGHILGSHEQIDGYYEMHINYHSWKSFIRQKLLYYRNHPVGRNSEYLFDKILHDYYVLNIELLMHKQSRVIFSIREPLQTIKSTVHQFRTRRPGHEYCDVANVTNYYVKRLNTLCEMAHKMPGYFYFDADLLRESPNSLLSNLTHWLNLTTPLTPEFGNFHFSGKGSAGDHSGRLSIGKVDKKKTDYSSIEIPELLISEARLAYQAAGVSLKSNAIKY